MPLILDGKKLRDLRVEALKKHISGLSELPKLVIFQIGNDERSNAYIAQKESFGKRIGVLVERRRLPESVSEESVVKEIIACNEDRSVSGIILQLPLPEKFDQLKILNTILPSKDVDGLTDFNQKQLTAGERTLVPATARGVYELLVHYQIPIKGKKVAVLGRSRLVGSPIAALMKNGGAIVEVCHSKTVNTKEITKKSDIVIIAIGKPRFLTEEYVVPGQTIVDVGINVVNDDSFSPLEEEIPRIKLVGDADFDRIKDIVGAISPVPGGVGPMTVCSLFENLLQAHGG